jgi:hypothetical protein
MTNQAKRWWWNHDNAAIHHKFHAAVHKRALDLLPLETRNRPYAADLLGIEPKPVTRLDFIERKTVQNVKINDRAVRGAVLLQLNADLSVGTIDFGDQAQEEFVRERKRA